MCTWNDSIKKKITEQIASASHHTILLLLFATIFSYFSRSALIHQTPTECFRMSSFRINARRLKDEISEPKPEALRSVHISRAALPYLLAPAPWQNNPLSSKRDFFWVQFWSKGDRFAGTEIMIVLTKGWLTQLGPKHMEIDSNFVNNKL